MSQIAILGMIIFLSLDERSKILDFCHFARPYCYDTASPPSVLAANLASLEVIKTESWRREKLHERVAFFREQVACFDLPHMDSTTPIQSIVIGDNARTLLISEKLQARGF